MSSIRVSIIVITKDRPKHLGRCLLSIINQKELFHACIIIDGSSSMETRRYVSSLGRITTPITYIFDETPGYAAARNRGIRAARADWIAFTDDDCVLTNTWLRKMKQAITRYPDADAIIGKSKTLYPDNPFSNALHFYELNWKLPAIRKDRVVDLEILDTKNIIFNARVFRKGHLQFRQEQYNGRLLSTDDIDMGMQMMQKNYSARYEPRAIIYHHDPTTMRSFFQKLLFDRMSYTHYLARWKKQRTQAVSMRRHTTKRAILHVLFSEQKTPLWTKAATRLILWCSNIILKLTNETP